MGKTANSVLERARQRNRETESETGGSTDPGTTGGTSTESTSTGTTTEGTGTTGRRRTPKPTDGIAIDGTTQGETLTNETVPRIEPPSGTPPKRDRKRNNTTSKKTAEKEATKAKELTQTAQMLSSLIKTLSDISSMRTGSHWQLSKEETDNIAKPLVGILDRYNLLEKIAQGSDMIALGTALSVAFAPRVMYQLQLNKQRRVKVNAESVRKLQTQQQSRVDTQSIPGVHHPDATESTGQNQSPIGQNSPDDQTSTAEFLTQFPATVPDSYY
ncbi:hypothetical protein [Paenibacillus sp. MER 99-2]|uniref:hypothetical protein n=1 Tax=Paenibacillus sp. MER 99-2 TaxID=2939572 RepID=UPI00203B149E|nr:hypothetical protein [Paenibacillus sp. MER 99-2]MCM3176221.1 hypothetical protein [Paenibacillus sp. MER 99-2]